MSLERTMARRGRRATSRVFTTVTRAMVRDWIEQTGMAERAGMTQSQAMAAGMRMLRRGQLEIEIDQERDLVRVRPRIL